jgi:DNA polymerase III alpha subunit (gram-positive type)
MSFIVVDVEADGPCPGEYSMVSVGAVVVEPTLTKTFYGEVKPISLHWEPDALAVSNISREQHLKFDDPYEVMPKFAEWVRLVSKGHPVFVSDNPCFDWQFINYYFIRYCEGDIRKRNPFGFSGRRIGDMYCGLVNDAYAKWKHLRKTKHTHHPVDDAKGNAEVLLHMKENMGFRIDLK